MIVKTFRQLYAMLRPRERRHFFLLLGLITLSGVADMVGVAAIVPFLSILSDPASVQDNRFLAWLYEVVAPADLDAFLFVLGMTVFAIIVLGTVIKLFTMYALARFSHMRKFHLGQRLLMGYLSQPYPWFLARHSSDLIKTIIQEVDQMIGMVMVPAMRVLAQAVSIVFLLVLLLVMEPVIALVVFGLFGVAYGGIFLFVRRRLTAYGADRVSSNTARFRAASEVLGGIKDVKLMGLEESYVRAYRKPALVHAKTLVGTQVIAELPRYALEAITFGGLVALILVLLRTGDAASDSAGALADIVPVLGLFAIAGLRMLPAIQNIYHSLTSLRAGQAVLQLVSEDLLAVEAAAGLAMPPQGSRLHLSDGTGTDSATGPFLAERLELRGAVYAYPGTGFRVLDGLDLEIAARSTVGIVGSTGAGKTTAVDVILGLLRLDAGGLYVDGVEIGLDQLRAWQDRIGYVPQQIFLVDDTVSANVAFGVPREQVDMAKVERAARLARLHDFVLSDLPKGYDTFVGERGVRLSGGQRQRIGIARALYHDPEILVLDEATSALDTITESAVMDAVAGLGKAKTIIMIAHRLTTVEACDRIFLLEKGKVADVGTYDELVARNATFSHMVGGGAQDPAPDPSSIPQDQG